LYSQTSRNGKRHCHTKLRKALLRGESDLYSPVVWEAKCFRGAVITRTLPFQFPGPSLGL
jgi:hypothetical protein